MSLNEEDKRWITEQIERAETRLLAEFAKRDADDQARRSKAAAILHEFEKDIQECKRKRN